MDDKLILVLAIGGAAWWWYDKKPAPASGNTRSVALADPKLAKNAKTIKKAFSVFRGGAKAPETAGAAIGAPKPPPPPKPSGRDIAGAVGGTAAAAGCAYVGAGIAAPVCGAAGSWAAEQAYDAGATAVNYVGGAAKDVGNYIGGLF
jgi:hypothetical protein